MPSMGLPNTLQFKTAEAAGTFFPKKNNVCATLLAIAGVKPGKEWQLQLPSEDHVVAIVRGRMQIYSPLSHNNWYLRCSIIWVI